MPRSRHNRTHKFRSRARNRNLLHRRHDHINFITWLYERLPYSVQVKLISDQIYGHLANKINRNPDKNKGLYERQMHNWECKLHEKSLALAIQLADDIAE